MGRAGFGPAAPIPSPSSTVAAVVQAEGEPGASGGQQACRDWHQELVRWMVMTGQPLSVRGIFVVLFFCGGFFFFRVCIFAICGCSRSGGGSSVGALGGGVRVEAVVGGGGESGRGCGMCGSGIVVVVVVIVVVMVGGLFVGVGGSGGGVFFSCSLR